MIQFPGAHGSWQVTVTPGANDGIHIRFAPDGSGDCRDIRLVQTVGVEGYDAAGNLVAGEDDELYRDPDDPAQNPFGPFRPDSVLVRRGARYCKIYVDHTACEGDPYYNGDDPQDARSKGSSVTHDPTEMDDAPSTSFDGIKPEIVRVVDRFETCAICAESGRCLGCVQWTSTATRTDLGTIEVTNGEQPCSDEGRQALRQFARRHSVRGADGINHWYCPEDGTERGWMPNGAYRGILFDEVARPSLPRAVRIPGLRRVAMRPAGAGAQLGGDALAAALDRPQGAALKFTWAGAQRKLRTSVVFSPVAKLSAAQLARLIPDDPRFRNDRYEILHAVTPAAIMRVLLGALPKQTVGGPTMVVIASGIGTGSISASALALSVAQTGALMRQLEAHEKLTPAVQQAASYVALNMGDGNRFMRGPQGSETESSPPRNPTPAAKTVSERGIDTGARRAAQDFRQRTVASDQAGRAVMEADALRRTEET